MGDVKDLTTDQQVEYARRNQESLDTHSGYSTDALRELSLDSSWLDQEDGNANEPPGLWYARIGRYVLTCNTTGEYESREFETPDLAFKFFEDIPAAIGETDAG